MSTAAVLIRGGRLIDPTAGVDAEADVLVRNGVVAEVGADLRPEGDAEVFDARGLIVAPGFIDLHVHLREPGQRHKETIASGTAAAAAGGFTSVCAMPNTDPVNDLPAITRWMLQPERGAVVNVFPIAAATVGSAGQALTDFAALHREGAVAFTDDGKPILHEGLMREALMRSAALGVPVVQHAEDTRLTIACSMHDGPYAFRLGLRGMPAEAESQIVWRDIDLAHETGGHLHIAHISTAQGVEAVRAAKRRGVRATCEVTPHHLALIDEDVGVYDTNFKMNPPLRSRSDREALLQAVADGIIDAIATDHAPHAVFEKQVEFDRAAFGVTGLETALGLAVRLLHRERGVALARIVELFTAAPARVLGGPLESRGTLNAGSIADITIFDPAKTWKFDPAQSRSKSRNTPFAGWELVGKVVATLVSGAFVYRD
jgi:dihydroorotase